MKKVLSLLAIFTLVVSIFSTIPVNNVQSKELKDYSGEELFEGVIFGYGEVAKLFPEMWEESLLNDFTYTDEQVQKIKEIESELKQVDPDFFTKFKEGIQSGDHVVIEETIQKTEESLIKVFEDEVKQASSDKKMRAMATKPGFVIALAYSYVGATHIAAAFVMTVVAVGTKFVGPSSVESDNLLAREQYIDLIAERIP